MGEHRDTSYTQETTDTPNRCAAEYKGEYPHHFGSCDQNTDLNTVQTENTESLNKQKEAEQEMRKKMKEEERMTKIEEQNRLQLQGELNANKQKELKERWDSQDTEDTLKRKIKLKEKEQK